MRKIFNNKKGDMSSWVTSFALIAFFAFCVFSFSLSYLNQTNPSSKIIQNKFMNNSINSMNSTISTFNNAESSVYNQMTSPDNQPSQTDYLFLIFKGAFYIPLSFLSFVVISIGNIGNVLFLSLGGTGLPALSMGLGMIITAIVIITILYIIQAIRTGQFKNR